jgi:hypothetical protein
MMMPLFAAVQFSRELKRATRWYVNQSPTIFAIPSPSST